MSEPKVSILIPAFNEESNLRACLNSVLEQEFADYEVLILDDCSSDGTGIISKEYCQADDRFIYIRNDRNVGLQKTLNKGLALARGELIARLDADDFWILKSKLKKQAGFLDANKDHALVGTGVVILDEYGEKLFSCVEKETDEEIRENILFGNRFTHSSVVFRKKAAMEFKGYDEGFKTTEDYSLWLKIGTRWKFYNLPDLATAHKITEKSISSRKTRTQFLESFNLAIRHRRHYPHFMLALLTYVQKSFFFILPRGLALKVSKIIKRKDASIKKYNILWVIGFTPEKVGSYEEFIFLVASEVAKMGGKVCFAFPGKPIAPVEEEIKKRGARIYLIPMRSRFDLISAVKIANLIRKEGINIVHSNFDRANYPCLYAAIATRPAVYIWHQHNFMSNRYVFARKILFALINKAANVMIVITNAMKDNLMDAGFNPSKIEVIYNGINLDKFKEHDEGKSVRIRKELDIPKGYMVVTCIGDARPEKGHALLLKAFIEVNNEYPNSILLFVGGKAGQCYRDLKDEVEKTGFNNKVIFTEMRSDVPEILGISDIIVMPPIIEVSLYSIMEAMEASKPVVASNVGGIPEVIKDRITGILFPPGNIESLKNEIVKLIKNPSLRENIGSAAREWTNKKFDVKRQVKDILELYEKFIQLK